MSSVVLGFERVPCLFYLGASSSSFLLLACLHSSFKDAQPLFDAGKLAQPHSVIQYASSRRQTYCLGVRIQQFTQDRRCLRRGIAKFADRLTNDLGPA